MERRRIVAEIARELGVPEEVVERTVYALLERFGEGQPALAVQLVSELRQIAHQIGRLEGEFEEFRRVVEPRLEQIGILSQQVEGMRAAFVEFREASGKRMERLEKWLFAFLAPMLLAILSLVARVFLFPL